MAQRPPERYTPGELDRTRRNLGDISSDEAQEMSRILGGEVGTEKSQEEIDKKYRELADLNRRRTDQFMRTANNSVVFEKISDSDAANRVPALYKPAEASYFQRVKMNFLAARPEHQLMRYSRAVLSLLSFAFPIKDLVNPGFVKKGDVVFFDHVEEFVSSVKALAAKAKGNPLTRKIHPFYFRVIDEICSWEVDRIHDELTRMQRSPRSITFEQCKNLCSAFYRPLISLMDLDEEFYVGGALKKLHDAVLMTIPKNHPDVDLIKRFYRTARIKMTLVFREMKFRLYPLLLKVSSQAIIDFDEFFVDNREEILDSLSLNPERVLHAPVIDDSDDWAEETAIINDGVDQTSETQHGSAAAAPDPLLSKEVQVGIEVLQKLFPGAGFGVLRENPDLYPYFQPLLDFPRGVELLSPADPLHQVVILVAILQELFYGFKAITFGTLKDTEGNTQGIAERIEMRLIAWRAVLDETILDAYVMELYEYCRQYEKEPLFGTTRMGMRLSTELEWKKKLLVLPHLSIQRPYGFNDEAMAHLPRLEREIEHLDLFLSVIARGIATGSHTDAVLNPNAPAIFEVTNPVSRRLAKVLQRDGKRLTNNQLILHTEAILSLLKALISDPNSHLYENDAPLFRTERGSDGMPMFAVLLVNPHEIIERHDRGNSVDEVSADGQSRDPATGFFVADLLKRYIESTAALCDARGESFCLIGLGVQGMANIEKTRGTDAAKAMELTLLQHIRRNIRAFSDLPFAISPGNYIIILPETTSDEALVPLRRVFFRIRRDANEEGEIPVCAAVVGYNADSSTDHHLKHLRSALRDVFRLPAPGLVVLNHSTGKAVPVSVD